MGWTRFKEKELVPIILNSFLILEVNWRIFVFDANNHGARVPHEAYLELDQKNPLYPPYIFFTCLSSNKVQTFKLIGNCPPHLDFYTPNQYGMEKVL